MVSGKYLYIRENDRRSLNKPKKVIIKNSFSEKSRRERVPLKAGRRNRRNQRNLMLRHSIACNCIFFFETLRVEWQYSTQRRTFPSNQSEENGNKLMRPP